MKNQEFLNERIFIIAFKKYFFISDVTDLRIERWQTKSQFRYEVKLWKILIDPCKNLQKGLFNGFSNNSIVS